MSVNADTTANSSSTRENGSAKASSSRRGALLRRGLASRLEPYFSRASPACSSVRPAGAADSFASSWASVQAAASRSHPSERRAAVFWAAAYALIHFIIMGRPSSFSVAWGREGAKKRPPLPVSGRSRAQRAHETKASGASACTLSVLVSAAGGLPAFVYCWGP